MSVLVNAGLLNGLKLSRRRFEECDEVSPAWLAALARFKNDGERRGRGWGIREITPEVAIFRWTPLGEGGLDVTLLKLVSNRDTAPA